MEDLLEEAISCIRDNQDYAEICYQRNHLPTFEEWWESEYRGTLGNFVMESAFREVAEKAWNARAHARHPLGTPRNSYREHPHQP